jgi:hypothetical protein
MSSLIFSRILYRWSVHCLSYETTTVGKCVLREVSCNQTRDYIRTVGMHMVFLMK